MSVGITIEGLVKRFGSTVAVDHLDLTIAPGQLYFLLGPSGCGKTTLLRMIAGLTEPSGGRIRFGDRDVTRVAPNKRNAGMVFQSYALWPHMSVRQNVAFGLKVRKVPREQRDEKVDQALAAVRMSQYAERKPAQLSGGQQQRVALARALVIEPEVLLLDEPLSNLDAALRLEMRHEIRRLCTQTGITTVYVTHDQAEALSMADSMAVLRDGKIEQIGPPRALYERPDSRFVAGFLGETNILPATVGARQNGKLTLETKAGVLETTNIPDPAPAAGSRVLCSVRPESLRFGRRAADAGGDGGALLGRISESIFLGATAQSMVDLAGDVRVKVSEINPGLKPREGEAVLVVDPGDVVIVEDR
jgi:iron(III) transport system ATP-binding protein